VTPTAESLRQQRLSSIKSAREIVERAKSAGRSDLTATEIAEVETHLDHAKNLDKQIAGRTLVNRVLSLDNVDTDAAAAPLFNETDRDGILHAVKSRMAYRLDLDSKALTTGAMLPPSGQCVEGRSCSWEAWPLIRRRSGSSIVTRRCGY
jgi:hypothetical protein